MNQKISKNLKATKAEISMYRPAIFVTTVAAGLVGISGASAATSSFRSQLVGENDPQLTLRGGYDAKIVPLQVPQSWESVRGRLRLSWKASQSIVKGSGFQVRLGDSILKSVEIRPGTGSTTVTIPATKIPAAYTSLPLILESRVKTDRDVCPAADDPLAWVQFSKGISIAASGRVTNEVPLISTATNELVNASGLRRASVLVRFTANPTPEMVKAAGIAVGEIAARTGISGSGLNVRISAPGEPTKRFSNEGEVVIGPGSGTLSVGRARQGALPTIRLAGDDSQLVTLAGGLRPSTASRLKRTRVSVAALKPLVARRTPLARRMKLPAAQGVGVRQVTASVPFRIPEYLQLESGAILRVPAAYKTPNGGQMTLSINERPLETVKLNTQGRTRYFFDKELAGRGPSLARSDIRPGYNVVQIQADLARQSNRNACGGSAATGSVSMLDFGSLSGNSQARKPQATLSYFPFPLSQNPGWEGSQLVLPDKPSKAELTGAVEMLAEQRRITDELVMPAVQFGGSADQGKHALVVTRQDQIPAEFDSAFKGSKLPGTLIATKSKTDKVQILAVGSAALKALSENYRVGKLNGRVVDAKDPENIIIRTPDATYPAGFRAGGSPYKWPLLIIGASILAIALLSLRNAVRNTKQRTNKGGHAAAHPSLAEAKPMPVQVEQTVVATEPVAGSKAKEPSLSSKPLLVEDSAQPEVRSIAPASDAVVPIRTSTVSTPEVKAPQTKDADWSFSSPPNVDDPVIWSAPEHAVNAGLLGRLRNWRSSRRR